MFSFSLSHFLFLCIIAKRPTVCVTRVWAGVDSAWEQEKLEARKMLEKAADSPPVQCTQCWAQRKQEQTEQIVESDICRRERKAKSQPSQHYDTSAGKAQQPKRKKPNRGSQLPRHKIAKQAGRQSDETEKEARLRLLRK